jgi:hypothetical protein
MRFIVARRDNPVTNLRGVTSSYYAGIEFSTFCYLRDALIRKGQACKACNQRPAAFITNRNGKNRDISNNSCVTCDRNFLINTSPRVSNP